jgi:MFS family permease
MGAGALLGAFTRQRVLDRFRGRALMFTITLFGLSGIGVGLATSIPLAGAFMFASGAFWVLTLTNLNATAQLMTPGWIRGRAMSLYSLSFGGILPIGAIIAGVIADFVGTGTAMVVLCSGSTILGLLSPRFRLPTLEEVETPEFSLDLEPPLHDETLEGGPVLIFNTWQIDDADFDAFTRVMNQVRLVRLRTGAYRWRLLRDVANPRRLTEMFAVGSWEEHLAQHRRIDDASAAEIRRARAFDKAGGPITRHLIAVDVESPPDFDELVLLHERMHETDGSIPTMVDHDAG